MVCESPVLSISNGGVEQREDMHVIYDLYDMSYYIADTPATTKNVWR